MAEVLLPSDRAFMRRYPHQLSGGQQQRVAIAMAFACRPKVIVLDEPTTALDVTTQAHVLETIRDLTRSYGVSALYVTHDLAVVANLADRIAVMYAGRIVEIGPRNALFPGAWHPYTRKLLAAIPDLSGERALHGIPGWAPRPGQRVAGCAFTPRCDWRIDKCAMEFPPYTGPDRGAPGAVLALGGGQGAAGVRSRDPCACTPTASDATAESMVVSARNVDAYYQTKEILHDVTAGLHDHRCLALVGESGSGKTTLARCIAGTAPLQDRGPNRAARQGARAGCSSARSRAERQAIQYIFQSPYSSLNPRKTIRQMLAQPLDVFFDLCARRGRGAHGAGTRPGGARLVAARPLPGAALRRRAAARRHRPRPRRRAERAHLRRGHVLARRVGAGRDHRAPRAACRRRPASRMLFVTHNLALIRSISQEVAVMNEGRIVEFGLVDAVLDDPQADYTKKLLADTPSLHTVQRHHRLKACRPSTCRGRRQRPPSCRPRRPTAATRSSWSATSACPRATACG